MESELTVAKVIIKTDDVSLYPSIDQIMDFLDGNEVEYEGVPAPLFTHDVTGNVNSIEEHGFKLRHLTHADALVSKSKMDGKKIPAKITN